ncbi:MAG: NTP transferase domain-containing protein [Kiloniellales bacterium]
MIFGDTPLDQAEGAILAHSVTAGDARFKKGRVLSADDLAALRKAGIRSVVAARLEPGDVHEDVAAATIAEAVTGEGLSASAAFTGRCNLIAETRGVLVIDRARLEALNLVDEAVTVATLPAYELIEPRQMAATIKIIPFAVSGPVLEACLAVAQRTGPIVRVAALRPRQVGLVQTTLPGLKPSILDKTKEAIDARLAALDCPPSLERRVAHKSDAVAAAIGALRAEGCALVLVSGASAIVDRRDVVPAGIEAAGGVIEHFGMPVDPGNLLLFAKKDGRPVVGLPGCARSPKLNGFDWVLQRLLADVPVTSRDLMLMGVGGLLKETSARPLPRAAAVEEAPAPAAPRAPSIAAVVLAAGRSTRMGPVNKLLADVAGAPMVRRVAEAVLASRAEPVVVVTGHNRDKVEAALTGLGVTTVHNSDYAAGLSTSLHRGLAAVPAEADGVVVCLGDMPRVSPAVIDRLIAAFNPVEGRAICVPTWQGKRGNPVLLARRFFAEIQAVAGDVGAKALIGEYPEVVAEVPMPDDAVLTDIDTPEMLAALRSAAERPA